MRTPYLLFVLVACSSDQSRQVICRGPVPCTLDSAFDSGPAICNALTQTGCQAGEKCTWIVDETAPQYVGHVGCAADGTVSIGSTCEDGAPGATGFDNCVKGGVCSAYGRTGSAGTCLLICDDQGGNPSCGSASACVTMPMLFSTGASSPPAAGVCEPTCDPLADNDFDGPGSALTRTGIVCEFPELGCYGAPRRGTPPSTAFTCMPDLHYATPLHHRAQCTSATGCADPGGTIVVNSCNQGYEPLLYEATGVTTVVCVALCAPLDCYAGNCGTGNANRLGAFPHRCQNPDALGSFGSDEECRYVWHDELDGSGHWLPSAYSDAVGYCVDHAAYGLTSCATVPLHGSGGSDDAVSLGCVSTTTAGVQP